MRKIALYGNFNDNIKKLFHELRQNEFEIIEVNNANEIDKLWDVDYLINRSFILDAKTIDSCKNLKLIQKWGVGYDKIDIKEAGNKKIPVAILAGINAQPVAEMAVLHILALYRNLINLHLKMKDHIWAKEEYATSSYMINGKTVGVIGIGSIGKRLAKILKGFGADIVYYDLYRLSTELEESLGYKYVELEELISISDIISLHLPLLDSTKNLIDLNSFRRMKSSAIIINTARGGIINEDDLIYALENKIIAGAGLDTFTNEPLKKDSPLMLLDNVILTPHCGGSTADNEINMVKSCLENITKFDNDQLLPDNIIVNKEYLD